jgi:hypothetical protein
MVSLLILSLDWAGRRRPEGIHAGAVLARLDGDALDDASTPPDLAV